jgi:4-diphosphocytidyl-2-C-methyl-D-erythritol kinase
MIALAPCKINLGLQITAKRPDGYHELDTVFYPIALHDAIEILPNAQSNESIVFTHSGLTIPGDTQNNLCIKAYHLLKKDFPSIPHIKMHLHKNIPMGAGLGGGSSDGSTVLKMLNTLFHLSLSNESLCYYALQLGSDCPFFIEQQACHATGRGEIFTPLQLDLTAYQIVLVHPNIHISTAWAFNQIHPQQPARTTDQLVKLPVPQWKDQLKNDFEKAVLLAHPELDQLKNNLYQQGATYVSMSGSGSSFFALFPLTINVKALTLNVSFRMDLI